MLADDTYILWYSRNNLTPAEVVDIHALIDTVPGDASILTQNHLFPHVSGRINAYAIPVTTFADEQLPAIETYLSGLIDRSDYVLLDTSDGNPLTPLTIRLIEADLRFAKTASAGDFTLYRRPL
ncbi:TPA: DUF2079 domain-containing protein [Candidatus Bathyarchaeota archaeon]|nr:DUF2079 domain-containing protein [Candidatus Bathyarchaeota archaeon]